MPKKRLLGLETTTAGQRKRMSAAYKRLAKVRRKMHITHAYWFAWATPYDNNTPQSDVSYRFTGLNKVTDGGVFARMPILKHLHEPRREVRGLSQVLERASLPLASDPAQSRWARRGAPPAANGRTLGPGAQAMTR